MLTLMRKPNQTIVIDEVIRFTILSVEGKQVHIEITDVEGIKVEFTKYEGEGILIDDDIKIKISKIKGIQTYISVGAPDNVSINREEIQERIDNNIPQKKGK